MKKLFKTLSLTIGSLLSQPLKNAAAAKPHLRQKLLVLSVVVITVSACSSPQSGSEEYWFNKMQMEQRAQCSQLPEPLSSNCLRDLAAKSYQDFVRERAAQQPRAH